MISERAADQLRASRPRVVSAGTYILDILGRPVSELPRGQVSMTLDEIRLTAAGTAGGTAVDLARLGAQVTAIGAIGRDLAGDMVVSALEIAGVDASRLRRRGAVQTSCTILPIHPDGSRPAWHVPGANSTFCLDDVDWDVIEQADAVHLGGLTTLPGVDGEAAAALLKRARQGGALTSADFLGVRGAGVVEMLSVVLPHVDLFMPNEGEALAVAGDTDCVTAARRLRDLGAGCVIVKRGGAGCIVVDDTGERALPAFQAPVVDTTGCGDAFCTGVIVARLAGWSIDGAADVACAAGALNMRRLGSDAGARDVDELIGFANDTVRRPLAPEHEDPTRGRLTAVS